MNPAMAKILLIEDDAMLAEMVADALRAQNFIADVAGSALDAGAYLSAAQYDLVILDWELPDSVGPDICHQIRRSNAANVPVLFLTARGSIADKEQGFESGADDYLTKPFAITELLLRVRALLRRPPVVQSKQLKVRDIVLDMAKHEVLQNGIKVDLFPKEYALLEFFMSHPNQIFSADALLRRIWSTESESSLETVRVTLMRIRQKLNSGEERPLIVTLRNVGYRLEP
jgi:DNA-binding response OmpR family regulator